MAKHNHSKEVKQFDRIKKEKLLENMLDKAIRNKKLRSAIAYIPGMIEVISERRSSNALQIYEELVQGADSTESSLVASQLPDLIKVGRSEFRKGLEATLKSKQSKVLYRAGKSIWKLEQQDLSEFQRAYNLMTESSIESAIGAMFSVENISNRNVRESCYHRSLLRKNPHLDFLLMQQVATEQKPMSNVLRQLSKSKRKEVPEMTTILCDRNNDQRKILEKYRKLEPIDRYNLFHIMHRTPLRKHYLQLTRQGLDDSDRDIRESAARFIGNTAQIDWDEFRNLHQQGISDEEGKVRFETAKSVKSAIRFNPEAAIRIIKDNIDHEDTMVWSGSKQATIGLLPENIDEFTEMNENSVDLDWDEETLVALISVHERYPEKFGSIIDAINTDLKEIVSEYSRNQFENIYYSVNGEVLVGSEDQSMLVEDPLRSRFIQAHLIAKGGYALPSKTDEMEVIAMILEEMFSTNQKEAIQKAKKYSKMWDSESRGFAIRAARGLIEVNSDLYSAYMKRALKDRSTTVRTLAMTTAPALHASIKREEVSQQDPNVVGLVEIFSKIKNGNVTTYELEKLSEIAHSSKMRKSTILQIQEGQSDIDELLKTASIRLDNHITRKRIATGGWSNVYLVQEDDDADEDYLKVLKVPTKNIHGNDNVERIIQKYGTLGKTLLALAKFEETVSKRTSSRSKDQFGRFQYRPLPQFYGLQRIQVGDRKSAGLLYEYIKGTTFDKFFQAERTVEEMLTALASAAYALSYIHEKGYTHNDIKGDNIIVAENGLSFLLDLAFSRIADGESSIRGVRSYMAPERLRGQPTSPLADQYSFGIMAYHMLAGIPPLSYDDTRGDKNKFVSMVGTGAIRPKVETIEKLPGRGIEQIIVRACSFDPKERYESMKEIESQLSDLI